MAGASPLRRRPHGACLNPGLQPARPAGHHGVDSAAVAAGGSQCGTRAVLAPATPLAHSHLRGGDSPRLGPAPGGPRIQRPSRGPPAGTAGSPPGVRPPMGGFPSLRGTRRRLGRQGLHPCDPNGVQPPEPARSLRRRRPVGLDGGRPEAHAPRPPGRSGAQHRVPGE